MIEKRKILNKKIMIPFLAIFIIGSGVIAISTSITAVKAIPFMEKDDLKINGTINAGETVKNYIKDSIKIPFTSAASTAVKQITNGNIIGGHIDWISGFLVYKFIVVNPENETLHKVIIDPGNGQVLYTSPGIQMGEDFFGTPGVLGGGFGPLGSHVLAGGFGHGPFEFGAWSTPGGFMGGGGIWH